MTPEEFRRIGHQLIDRIADYRSSVAERPVMSANAPGALRAALPKEAPLKPEGFDAIFSDLDELIIPGLSHWQSPKFFGYFPANSELSSVLGDYLSTGLGALGLSWQAGPALTELEEVVVDWMRQLVGLSDALERRHPGHGVDQHDGRADLRARADQRLRARARRPAGERGAADRLCLRAFAYLRSTRARCSPASAATTSA